jgi:hypothetical protein
VKFLTLVSLSRYGWFSYFEPKTLGNFSSSTPPIDCSQSEGTQKGCNNNMEVTYGKGKQIEVTSEELKGINVSEITAAIVAEEVANGPVDLVVNFMLPFFLFCFCFFPLHF